MWREMKDWIEHHSPIPMQAILSSRKTPNSTRNVRENTLPTDHLIHHLNHLIHHLNHLIDHLNHLIHHLDHLIELQDLLQRWQNNTSVFFKHHRKLEADLDSRAEVSQSSSVLFTSIQAEMMLISVCDVIDVKCIVILSSVLSTRTLCHLCQHRAILETAVAFLPPNHWKELHSV